MPLHGAVGSYHSRHSQVNRFFLDHGTAVIIAAVQVEGCIGSLTGDLVDGATVDIGRGKQCLIHAQRNIALNICAQGHCSVGMACHINVGT